MRIFKRISKIIFMAAVAVTVIISAAVVAGATSGTSGTCTWTLDNNVLTITDNTGNKKGDTGDYKNSAASRPAWYSYKSSITEVVIESGVVYIGDYAFAGLTNLKTVTIPDTLTGIGNCAFSGCTALTKVNFNATKCVTMGSMSEPVFYKCSALTDINIGSGVKYIPEYAFEMCTAVTSITVPESVYYIGGYAFAYCSALESITMSDKLTELPEYVFYNCSSLSSIETPALMTKIGNYAFFNCSELKSMTIPAVVSQIGYGAFEGCTKLAITTTSGSYAELVAQQYGISYTATGGSAGGSYVPEVSAETNTNAAFYNGSLVLGVKFDKVLDGECVHIAFYNDANQVVNYYIVPVFGKMDNINFAIDSDDIASATYAKVFIWDSLESCLPVSSPELVTLK